ncbi:hypothetical protein O7632_29030 [Solwaraspora sp. WMMD406]|uniref:hypothetical protein n=1 Tax=Solwaraspora sp. WMMD406 TaxID=3016095 RepID=UPI002417E419|nr:hypothetical protein [Solwaraspora sp. WMMD406]MDG4768104.1 hypothetical protein [Solwaraspora sp. WMMD406]
MRDLDESVPERRSGDADRLVDLSDDDLPLPPERSVDDTDHGWGDQIGSNDERLLAERPPHWG